MLLNLVVLRANDVDRLGRFYEALGLTFERERHGAGPEHLACSAGGSIFEIYPCRGASSTVGVRIGFSVDQVASRYETAIANGAVSVLSPQRGLWGERAVVRDPEGHTVEFLRAPTAQDPIIADFGLIPPGILI